MKRILLPLLAILLFLSIQAQESKKPFKFNFGPYIQNVTEDGATIIWGTTNDALSWVEIAPDDDEHFYAKERESHYQTVLGSRVIGQMHMVRVKNLDSATSYRYRICSREVDRLHNRVNYGQTITNANYKFDPAMFKTRDPKQKEVSFVMVNDIHENNKLLETLLRDAKKEKYDFVVYNGDMMSDIRSQQHLIDGLLSKSSQVFASEIPIYFARGNHESRGDYAQYFMDYFPTETNMPYYMFSYGPICFLVLDSGEDKPDSDIEYHGLAEFDSYREEQAEWLKKAVESEEYKNAKFRVVLTHVPPTNITWHGPLEVKRLFMPILNNADVDIMLCGHLHSNDYVDKKKGECNFPVLINSNFTSLKVKADEHKMELAVQDTLKKVISTYTLSK